MSLLYARTRLERQRLRVRTLVLASSREDFAPRPTAEILALARARHNEHASQDDAAGPDNPRPVPLALAGLLPPEREMFLRIFSGPSKTTRRKAVRAWQHQIRRVREQARQNRGPLNPQPDATYKQ